ncbi:MAG: hypothetical protein KHY77_10695 [Butyricicoccus pullicaecorum]|nr:hypothetical protein [Butyricicoccus pullicaecorum]
MKLGILWTERSRNYKDGDKSAGIQIEKGNKKRPFQVFQSRKSGRTMTFSAAYKWFSGFSSVSQSYSAQIIYMIPKFFSCFVKNIDFSSINDIICSIIIYPSDFPCYRQAVACGGAIIKSNTCRQKIYALY